MKLCTINDECLANMHTNTHHFILLNNDFTGFVYELRGQPSYYTKTTCTSSFHAQKHLQSFKTIKRKLLEELCLQGTHYVYTSIAFHVKKKKET